MKFARCGPAGAERSVVAGSDGVWRDLGARVPDLGPTSSTALAAGELADLPEIGDPGRFGAPLAHVGKIVCVGMNYRDHAAETGAEPPTEPILFLKSGDTVVGPDDDVLIPRGSTKTDWEVELAVVIGARAHYLDCPEQSVRHIAGYAISHDVSERAFQFERGGQWDKGKNCATFNPLGPWLVTPDELGAPDALGLRLWVNDVLRQDGSTANMIFDVSHLVWYISQFMVLYPGDVINTGTPAGVALGRPGQPYLRSGDMVRLEIDGLGQQRQRVGQA